MRISKIQLENINIVNCSLRKRERSLSVFLLFFTEAEDGFENYRGNFIKT
jgi:hypothetical protein